MEKDYRTNYNEYFENLRKRCYLRHFEFAKAIISSEGKFRYLDF